MHLGPFTPLGIATAALLIVGSVIAAWAPPVKAALGLTAARAVSRPWTLLTCAFVGDVGPVSRRERRNDPWRRLQAARRAATHSAAAAHPPAARSPWPMPSPRCFCCASWSRCTAQKSCSSCWPLLQWWRPAALWQSSRCAGLPQLAAPRDETNHLRALLYSPESLQTYLRYLRYDQGHAPKSSVHTRHRQPQ